VGDEIALGKKGETGDGFGGEIWRGRRQTSASWREREGAERGISRRRCSVESPCTARRRAASRGDSASGNGTSPSPGLATKTPSMGRRGGVSVKCPLNRRPLETGCTCPYGCWTPTPSSRKDAHPPSPSTLATVQGTTSVAIERTNSPSRTQDCLPRHYAQVR
jgi:hypothetical protein